MRARRYAPWNRSQVLRSTIGVSTLLTSTQLIQSYDPTQHKHSLREGEAMAVDSLLIDKYIVIDMTVTYVDA